MNEKIILYDGVCGMCNRIVQFVLKRDKRDRFQFASLQSSFARDVLVKHSKNPDELDTMYVVVDHGLASERLVWKGRAAMLILRELGGFWRVVSWLSILPAGLLNFGYEIVANNRYRIFGKSDSCMLPSPQQRHKFIEV